MTATRQAVLSAAALSARRRSPAALAIVLTACLLLFGCATTEPAPVPTTGRQSAVVMADRLSRVSSDAAYRQELKQLDRFTDLHGADPDTMAQFMRRLGPDGLAVALSRAANQADEEGHRATGQLRSAFAAATHGWDAAQTRAFVDGLFEGAELPKNGRGLSIAFLFGADHQPGASPLEIPSREASFDAADRAEAFETTHGPFVEAGTLRPGLINTLIRERPDRFRPATVDVTSAVLHTLAQYPSATVEWFADGGAERVTRWFRGRDWAVTGDGYETPAALLVSLQLALSQTWATGDRDRSKSAMASIAHAMDDLADARVAGELDLSEVDARASVDFAVFSLLVAPYFRESVLAVDGGGLFATPDELKVGVIDRDGAIIPALYRSTYGETLRLAYMTPQGAAVVDGYVNSLPDLIMAAPSSDSVDALLWLVALDGLRCGARDTAIVKSGVDVDRKLDTAARKKVDAALSLVRAVPIPKSSLSGLSSPVIDWNASQVRDAGEDPTVAQLASTAIARGNAGQKVGSWSADHATFSRNTIDSGVDADRYLLFQWFDDARAYLGKAGVDVSGLPVGGAGGGAQATWEDAYASAAEFW